MKRNLKEELIEEAQFQTKCVHHWITESQKCLEKFNKIREASDKDDYSLDFNGEKEDATNREMKKVLKDLDILNRRYEIEMQAIDKIRNKIKGINVG